MSSNRRTTGEEPGRDCPEEITFVEFLERCTLSPICRLQGHHESGTKRAGRLVRFNRAVRVKVDTARETKAGYPIVSAVRVEWNPILHEYVDTKQVMTISWRLLDWYTPQASNDPNGTWVKITQIGQRSIPADESSG